MGFSKKIIIIQTAYIGDVILTTPLVEVLNDEFPHSEIDFLTIPKSKNLLENNPKIKNLIIFDKKGRDRGIGGLLRIGNLLKDNHYDICITPHRSVRSAFLTWMTKSSIRIGFNRSAWKWAFSHIVTYDFQDHEIERNLSLLTAIGLSKQKSTPVLYYTEDDKISVDKHLNQMDLKNSKLLAVAPGSVWPTKKWPESYYIDFCQMISEKGITPILVGGPDDQDLCERISDKYKHVFSIAGKLTLRETYYLLTRCRGILTNDSAPLHLGMAANIEVFAIFGPTIPEFGFAPFGPKSHIFEMHDMACRPCAIHGGKKCPIKTFDCMLLQEPGQVTQQVVEKILSRFNNEGFGK